MNSNQNVVPSKLYTTEAANSQKQTKDELEQEDPSKEDGLDVLLGSKKEDGDNSNSNA
jgi:hypothetical protein